MEAIHIVCRKADDLGVSTDKDMSWIKPISFQKYMDERFVSMLHEIQLDHGMFQGGISVDQLKEMIKKEEELELA
jgi:hypothetical protein